jgi:hypothetical protein
MEKYKQECIHHKTADYCYFADALAHTTVCRWENLEGYDIHIDGSKDMGQRFLQLTDGEFKLIKKLIKELDK